MRFVFWRHMHSCTAVDANVIRVGQCGIGQALRLCMLTFLFVVGHCGHKGVSSDCWILEY